MCMHVYACVFLCMQVYRPAYVYLCFPVYACVCMTSRVCLPMYVGPACLSGVARGGHGGHAPQLLVNVFFTNYFTLLCYFSV